MNKGIVCVNQETDLCNKYINRNAMGQYIEEQCLGKEICTVTDFGDFLKDESFIKAQEGYKRCTDDDAMLYIQAFCL